MNEGDVTLQPDQRFGKYQIVDRIAATEISEVFKARLEGIAGFQRPFAIKRIRAAYSEDPGYVERLVEQAKMAGLLTHANIVQILDLGQVDGLYYVAMEYVEGRDLGTILRRCREKGITLPVPHAVWVAIEILKGLEYAHQKQIMRGSQQVPLELVHRDVTPSNVLVSFQGEAKLTDFGIAWANARARDARGRPRGDEDDLAYLSPEQLRGQALDQRSDLFSTGVVLYEMLTGRHPFQIGAGPQALQAAILRGEYEPPSFVNPDVPYGLERALEQALQTNPDLRYPEATAFKEALNNFFHDSGFIFSHSTLAAFLKGLFPERSGKRAPIDDDADDETRPLRPEDLIEWGPGRNDTAILDRSALDHAIERGAIERGAFEQGSFVRELETAENPTMVNPTLVSGAASPAIGEESTLIRKAEQAILGIDARGVDPRSLDRPGLGQMPALGLDSGEWEEEQRTEIREDLSEIYQSAIEAPNEPTRPHVAPPREPGAQESGAEGFPLRPVSGALAPDKRAFLDAPTRKHGRDDPDVGLDMEPPTPLADALAPEVLVDDPGSDEILEDAAPRPSSRARFFTAIVALVALAFGTTAGFALGLISGALFRDEPEAPVVVKAPPRLSVFLPEGAILRVDAREVRPADPPPTQLTLSPGVSTEVRVELDGYAPFTQTYTLDDNDLRTLVVEAATLQPIER